MPITRSVENSKNLRCAYKKGDKQDKNKYRSFSMLSIPSKFTESCAADDTKEQNVLVNDKQCAFKKDR